MRRYWLLETAFWHGICVAYCSATGSVLLTSQCLGFDAGNMQRVTHWRCLVSITCVGFEKFVA